MKHLFIFFLLIPAISCKTKTTGWHTLDFGVFTLRSPEDWTIFKEKGFDSYVGGFTNGKDSMWFDYGWYSGEIDNDQASTHLYAQDTINGLLAIIQIPKVDGQGSIRLNIRQVNSKDKFDLSGYNIKGTDTILKIFKSIVFKESDTTINSRLTPAKFKNYPFGSGRTLYYAKCAACHHPLKFLTGPPLIEILKQRDNNWVFRFLTDRKSIVVDSLYKARVNEAGSIHCMEFPELRKSDVDQLWHYINTCK